MTIRRTAFLISFLMLAFSLPVQAQTAGKGGAKKAGDEVEMPGADDEVDLPPADADPATPSDKDLETSDADVAPTTPVLTTGKRVESRRTWKDIVVIPRKPFIKKGRFDITPTFTVTVNDNIIQHYSLGLEVNYHITDVLSLGIAGQYYFKNILDQEFWTRYHYSRVPAMNKYNYTVALNFTYVPIYGKLAILNDWILHYEVFASAGVGGSGTEIVPKDYRYKTFANPFSLTFPVGMGGRVFVNKFFAIQAGIRDYMMVDKFEGPRGNCDSKVNPACSDADDAVRADAEVEVARDNAKTRFINNLQFFLGFSFYVPPSFEYTTFR
jgi:outer membrane beta-barrel protein